MFSRLLFAIVGVCLALVATAQGISSALPQPARTYAIVVGISNYQSKRIPALKYADRDAAMFANFLQSASGGLVPGKNIKLLLNERATFSAIYDAMSNLLEQVKPNDRVFFYFSGHGDVETRTTVNLGYLLAYNTPASNYINHAVRLEDLNDFANTISTKFNAQTILITDACRSGKLAGDAVSGRRWVGAQLRKVQRNEVRFASCAANELSAENIGWGGGRGVFSYYLLRGLYGLAPASAPGFIDAKSVRDYLSAAFAADKILKQQRHKQTPLVTGNTSIALAKTDRKIRAEFKRLDTIPSPVAGFSVQLSTLKGLPVSLLDFVINALEDNGFEKFIDFNQLTKLPKNELFRAVTDSLTPRLSVAGKDSLTQFLKTTAQSHTASARFNETFATLISTSGQAIIEAYLTGSDAELERRSYNNTKRTGFDKYVQMYDLAISLLPPNHYLRRGLTIDRHYFAGVFARLRINTVANGKPFLDSSLAHQRRAMALEPNAAYIHNEMGLVLLGYGKLDSAEYHFKLATDLAATWAIPWSNLVGFYNSKGNLVQAKIAASKARALQPNLSVLAVNEGVTADIERNYLKAEGLYRRSLSQNSLHYLPFERLAYTYAATMRYRQADSNFYAASTRKQGYFFKQREFMFSELNSSALMVFAKPGSGIDSCWFLMHADLFNADSLTLLLAPMQHWINGLVPMADTLFAAAIAAQPNNFLLRYYYAKFLMEQQRWVEAEPQLQQASKTYLDANAFKLRVSAARPALAKYPDSACYRRLLLALHYPQNDHHFLLGKVYQSIGYFSQAEWSWRQAMKVDSSISTLAAYYLLAGMHERNGNYFAAERVWIEYVQRLPSFLASFPDRESVLWRHLNTGKGAYELQQFYNRVLKENSTSVEWHNRAAAYWINQIVEKNSWSYAASFDNELGLPTADLLAYDNITSLVNSRVIRLPVLDYKIPFSWPVEFPVMRAMQVASQAALMVDDDERIVAINAGMAGLQQIAKQPDSVGLFFEKALEAKPDNASVRRQYASNLTERFHLEAAFFQLDTLFSKQQLLQTDWLKFGEMALYSGSFLRAKLLIPALRQLAAGTPSDAALPFEAKYYASNGEVLAAIKFLQDSIPESLKTQPEICYLLATLLSKTADVVGAEQQLQLALEKGFRWGYLLAEDPALDALRSRPAFNKLLSRHKHQFANYEPNREQRPIVIDAPQGFRPKIVIEQ